jgi:hypothetical protein
MDQILLLYSSSETDQALVITKEPIERCSNNDVALDSVTRDMNIPMLLERSFGQVKFGIYARVTAPGTKNPGDTITDIRKPSAITLSGQRSAIKDQSSPTAVSAVASASSGASGTFFVTNAGISSTSSALTIG